MHSVKDHASIALLGMIAVLLVLNLFAARFEGRIAQAGGGVQGEGIIAVAGQNTNGPETLWVINTHRGPARKYQNFEFKDNGPRLAVYRLDANGRVRLSSMRNIGADVDEWLDHMFPDEQGVTVREVKKANLEAAIKKAEGKDPDAAGSGDLPPIEDE